jgi:predicted CXXCH cytochrome family protein
MIRLPIFNKYAVVSILLFVCVAFYFAACAPTPSRKPKKRTRFQRKECLECHTQFADKYLAMKNVHAVVKEKKCEDCHLRHGIIPKLLLKREGNKTCYKCHESQKLGLDKAVVHTALKKDKCISCHNPHASPVKLLLKAEGRQLCYQCHQQKSYQKKIVHKPLQTETCATCHLSHSSDQPDLLKAKAVSVCMTCHNTKQAPFKAAHRDYPVETASCDSCHNPHSSLQPKLLKASAHSPVVKIDCQKCHQAAASQNPFTTTQKGRRLCHECHKPSELKAGGNIEHPPFQEGNVFPVITPTPRKTRRCWPSRATTCVLFVIRIKIYRWKPRIKP